MSDNASPHKRTTTPTANADGRAIVRCDNRSVTINCDASTTVFAFKTQLHTEFGIPLIRQRLQYHHGSERGTVLNDDAKTLMDFGIPVNGRTIPVLHLKDLGLQMDWRTVFMVEYSGPLIIHQLIALFRGFGGLTHMQWLAWAMITLHYAKRLYESLFVHRFSHATMPLSACIRNCTHYWLIGGLWMAYAIYFNNHTTNNINVERKALAMIFVAAELGNFYSHLKLRWLRPQGSTKRAIPEGFPFTLVSCPNYLFEAIAWCSFAKFVNLPVAWLFALAGTVQMWIWAQKKHRNYLKEFPGYPKNRTAMIPFIC